MKIFYPVIDKLINGILLYLAKSGFLKNAANLAGATALSQIVLVLASLILTRLYTPEDFGILAIFTALIAQLLVVANLRYEFAIPLPEDEQTSVDLLVLCVILNCGIAALISISIIADGHQIALWLKTSALEPFLWMLPIVLLFGGWYQAFNYWSLRKKAFGLLAQTKLSQSVWTTGSQISLGFLTHGALGLLVGAVLNQVVGTGALVLFFWRNCRNQLKNFSLNRLVLVSRKYYKFPVFSVWSSLCNSAGLIAPTVLLLWFYDPKTVGSFALAQRVTSIPTTLIGNSISQVFLANASSLICENPCELKRLYSRASILLLGISLLIGFGLMFSPWFFPLLFGEKWQESGIMVQYMAMMFVPSLCIAPLTLLDWLQKQHWFFAWNLIRLVLVCLGFWLAHSANWSATGAIAVFSLIMTIMYVLLLIINWYAINLIITQHSSQLLNKK